MRPTINTEKHYTQVSLFTVASGAIRNEELITSAAVPSGAKEVREGAIVSAIYIEMWITTDDNVLGSHIVTLEKISSAGANLTVGASAALNVYTNKKNIFYTCMGLTPTNIQYPFACIKGWFKIPKGKQRFSLGDSLVLNIHGQSNGLTGCGFAIFKEQY